MPEVIEAKAIELRIDNWVMQNGIYYRVHAVDIDYIYHGHIVVFPIPLTPEILEKAGLKLILDSDGVKYAKVGLVFLLWATDHLIVSYKDSDRTYVDVHAERIYYLHQIQNLYFALTGKEICINKPL